MPIPHASFLVLTLLQPAPAAPVGSLEPQGEARIAQAADRGGAAPTLQMYDVSDLLDATPDSFPLADEAREPRPSSRRRPLSGLGYLGEEPEASPRQRRDRIKALTRLVRGFVSPALVEGRDEIVIQEVQGMLLVNAPATCQAWTRRFLDLQRRPPLHLEVRLWALETPAGTLAGLGVAADGRTSLQPGAAPDFLERATKLGSNLLAAPRMVLFERAIASLSALDEFTYVKEFRFVTVQPGNQTIADPVIETLAEGWSMEVLAAEVGAGEFGVELYARQQVVQRPVPTQEISIGRDATATVSTPVGLTHELKTRFVVPLEVLPYDGETWQDSAAPALVFRVVTSAKDRELAVMIQVRAREAKPAEPATPPAGRR